MYAYYILTIDSRTTLKLTNCTSTFQIGGAVALGVGLWVWVSRAFSSTLMSNNMFIASVGVVVAMGAALMLLSLLGCCGAAKEVKCMLLTVRL